MSRLTFLALLCFATPALAEPQPPECAVPETSTDIWGPLKPLPSELRPEVDWAKLLAPCKERKVTVTEGKDAPRTNGHMTRKLDGAGRVTHVEQSSGGAVETTLDFSYDDKGHVTRRVEKYAGSGSIHAYTLTHTYTWDAAGRLQHVTKEGGGAPDKTEMSFTYDADGRLLRRADDAAGKSGWAITRSKTGAPIGLTSGAFDKPTVLYDGTADDKGRLAHVKSTQASQEDDLVYDAAGREVKRTTKTASGTDVVKLGYDAAGHLVKIEGSGAGGTTLREAKYDGAGHMISATWSSHRTNSGYEMTDTQELSFSYDSAGRLIGEKESAGGGSGGHGYNMTSETTYRYDGSGHLVEVKSHAQGYPPLDRTTVTTYSY